MLAGPSTPDGCAALVVNSQLEEFIQELISNVASTGQFDLTRVDRASLEKSKVELIYGQK